MIAVGYALQPSVGAESVQAQQQTPLECLGVERLMRRQAGEVAGDADP